MTETALIKERYERANVLSASLRYSICLNQCISRRVCRRRSAGSPKNRLRISAKTKAAVAVGLTAFAIGKTVVFYMAESGYTTWSGSPSNNSWDNLTVISGWFNVKK